MVDLKSIKFGVELETIKRSRQTVAQAIQSVVGGEITHVASPACFDPWEVLDSSNRTWRVVADASLTSVPVHLRAEVVSPVLTYDDIPILQDVVRAVRRCGSVTDDCTGIHVHISHPDITPKALANLACEPARKIDPPSASNHDPSLNAQHTLDEVGHHWPPILHPEGSLLYADSQSTSERV
jgi:hypothetical protein